MSHLVLVLESREDRGKVEKRGRANRSTPGSIGCLARWAAHHHMAFALFGGLKKNKIPTTCNRTTSWVGAPGSPGSSAGALFAWPMGRPWKDLRLSTIRKGTDLPRPHFSPQAAATPATKKKAIVHTSTPLSIM
jgi:hypothetical protein